MYETTITYNNADGLFRYDDEIRATMNWWHGDETDSGQDLETRTRNITFAFEDERNAIKASEALEGLLGEYFEPKSTDAPDQPQVPRDSAANQCARSAEAIFDTLSKRLGWDFPMQADVLLNWFGEDMIDLLLQHTQEAGSTEDFEEFLVDNFGRPPTPTGG